MAKVSSVRPPSQDGGPATRATRSTRSQSREPVEQPATTQRPVSRGGQGSIAHTAAPKKRGRKPKAATELTTVQENDGAQQNEDIDEDRLRQQLQAGIDGANVAAATDFQHTRRASAISRMSGTTVKTSFSQEELGELNAEVIVDVLPQVFAAAEALAKHLVPVDPNARAVVRKEIRIDGSSINKGYNRRMAARNLYRDDLGHSPEYIQPTIVLRALLAVRSMQDVPEGPWRPDSVIYKINLAQMLNCVLVELIDNVEITEEGRSAIDNLDVHFSAGIAGPEFKQNAFEFWLAFLTQLAIIHVTQDMHYPGFVAETVVMNTFYVPDQDGDLLFRHRNVLHMLDLPDEEQTVYSNAIGELVDHLVGTFKAGVNTVSALGALQAQYPWETFVEHTVQYYFERKAELDGQIAAVGGFDQIMAELNAEAVRRKSAREAEVKRLSFSRPGGTPKQSFGKGAIKSLQARGKRLAANDGAPPTPPTTAAAPVAPMTDPALQPQQPAVAQPAVTQPEQVVVPDDDGYIRPEDDDYEPPQTEAQSTARWTLATMQQLQAAQRQNALKGKAKARSFNDRQEGATRVEWEDGTQQTNYEVPPRTQYPMSTEPAQGPYFHSQRRTAAKRAHVEDDDEEEEESQDFEPTQDHGFQEDARDITAAADQRRREAPQARPIAQPRASQPRASNIAPSATLGPSGRTPASTASPAAHRSAKAQRKNPGSAIPAPDQPFDPRDAEVPRDQRMNRAKVMARHGTMTARLNRPTQQRQPWSEDEENALMDLIEEEGEYGIHYAQLKALDAALQEPKLGRRSAEDMRFKARNMKETFLKGRSVLPQNFKFIVLDKKAITKLQNLGIPYDQDRIRGGQVEIEMQ